jgi:hypothetical protein
MYSEKVFGPKASELSIEMRILHNKKLHDMYNSSSVARITKLRRLQWGGHAV